MAVLVLVIDLLVNALRLGRNALAQMLPAPEYVVLVAGGTLPERRAPARGWLQRLLPQPFLAPPQESLEEWRERLRLLAGDPRVRGAVLKLGDLRAGAASLESLRRALEEFRGSGKRLIAYIPTADLLGFYLASVAEQVVAPEAAELWLHGLRTEITFLRVALDRLGITPQYEHIAEYKTASHRFLYPQMTEPQREMMESLLDSQFAEVVSATARSRGLSEEAVRAAVDRGILTGTAARELRLVDGLAFEDDLPGLLGAPGRAVRILPWAQARARVRLPYRWRTGPRRAIGVVQLIGAIVPGESRDLPVPVPLLGAHLAGHETIARAFRAAERHPAVRAVVFHIDSGGGSAIAAEMIWREVARLQQRKPVVVYMGNVAGSGGYYVACGAGRIVAGATTITGSIGVVAGKFNLRPFFDRLGLHREVLSRGETARMFSAFTDFSEQEWAQLRAWMQDLYGRFTSRVATGRTQDVSRVESLARGRVYTGRQAHGLGLIDEVGDLEAAVRAAKDLAGIPETVDVPVLTVRPPKAAGVPQASAAAWVEALSAAARLLADPVLLLTPLDGVR